jgi:hypothetical protein
MKIGSNIKIIAKTSIDKNKKDYSEIKWFAMNFHYLS